MKLIKELSIWDNGSQKKATILNAYVVNLILNQQAIIDGLIARIEALENN
jgi:ribosome-associated protein YbcJ (S4-like RNA binding protein)